MPIKNSCFISYRRLSAEYARDFHFSLERELCLYTSLPIFRDEERLSGGDFYNKELALALCESACMVMIYTPTYFDKISTYCAREYKAMELLETQRLKQLGYEKNNQHSLIIPVIYRGLDYFPSRIKNLRAYYEFEFSVCGKSYLKRKEYQEAITKIAKYIFDRCQELNAIKKDPCKKCETFKLPVAGEISSWLSNMLPPKPVFPGRNGKIS
jgi:hypothetical protein